MKRSADFTAGVYSYEWLDDRIEVTELTEKPKEPGQWFEVEPHMSHVLFYLMGNSNEDIRPYPVMGDDIEFFSTSG